MSAKLVDFFDQNNEVLPIEPVSPEQLEAERREHNQGLIQIEFWMNDFTFANENDAPITGTINSQEHQSKLLRRAMERARDEGKRLVVKSGMNTRRFEQVTDEDIALYVRS